MAKAAVRFDSIELDRWVDKLAANLSDVIPILHALYATIGFKNIIDHFNKEEGPDGKWKQRTRFTQELYQAIKDGVAEPAPGIPRSAYNPSNKILQLTGDTRKSILPANSRRLNRNSILVFATTNYSGQHDRGEKSISSHLRIIKSAFGRKLKFNVAVNVKAHTRKMTRRQFMWLSNDAKQKMVDAAAKMVMP